MSIASALLGLGIALAIIGGVGSFIGIVAAMTMMECGSRRELRQACVFLSVMVAIFSVGVFLLGLTSPAVQS